jgi:uncharacterized membrane protein YqaE (UPF0057 family)
MKNVFKLLSISFAVGLLMTSCAGSFTIHKRQHSKGYFIASNKKFKATETPAKENEKTTINKSNVVKPVNEESTITFATTEPTSVVNNETFVADNTPSSVFVASHKKQNIVLNEKPVAVENTRVNNTNTEKLFTKKDLRKELRKSKFSGDDKMVLYVILSIILPPLAVYLQRDLGKDFWINLILTLLFIVPGIVHALLITFDVI